MESKKETKHQFLENLRFLPWIIRCSGAIILITAHVFQVSVWSHVTFLLLLLLSPILQILINPPGPEDIVALYEKAAIMGLATCWDEIWCCFEVLFIVVLNGCVHLSKVSNNVTVKKPETKGVAKVIDKIPEKVEENHKELNESDQKSEEHNTKKLKEHQQHVSMSDHNNELNNLKLKHRAKLIFLETATQQLNKKINTLGSEKCDIISDLYELTQEIEGYNARLESEKTEHENRINSIEEEMSDLARKLHVESMNSQHYFSYMNYYARCNDLLLQRIHELHSELEAEYSSARYHEDRVHRLEGEIAGLESEIAYLNDKLHVISSTSQTTYGDYFG